MTDDIYEAIAFWMHLLKDRYGGKLFGVNLNDFIDKVLKQQPAEVAHDPSIAYSVVRYDPIGCTPSVVALVQEAN